MCSKCSKCSKDEIVSYAESVWSYEYMWDSSPCANNTPEQNLQLLHTVSSQDVMPKEYKTYFGRVRHSCFVCKSFKPILTKIQECIAQSKCVLDAYYGWTITCFCCTNYVVFDLICATSSSSDIIKYLPGSTGFQAHIMLDHLCARNTDLPNVINGQPISNWFATESWRSPPRLLEYLSNMGKPLHLPIPYKLLNPLTTTWILDHFPRDYPFLNSSTSYLLTSTDSCFNLVTVLLLVFIGKFPLDTRAISILIRLINSSPLFHNFPNKKIKDHVFDYVRESLTSKKVTILTNAWHLSQPLENDGDSFDDNLVELLLTSVDNPTACRVIKWLFTHPRFCVPMDHNYWLLHAHKHQLLMFLTRHDIEDFAVSPGDEDYDTDILRPTIDRRVLDFVFPTQQQPPVSHKPPNFIEFPKHTLCFTHKGREFKIPVYLDHLVERASFFKKLTIDHSFNPAIAATYNDGSKTEVELEDGFPDEFDNIEMILQHYLTVLYCGYLPAGITTNDVITLHEFASYVGDENTTQLVYSWLDSYYLSNFEGHRFCFLTGDCVVCKNWLTPGVVEN
jgi:hypothetical protein